MKLFEIENGNLHTTIYDDGTKVREFEGTPNPEFPESIDVKITNYCDLACAYCHENSTKEGEHAFLSDLLPLFVDLPQGTELAIGGGAPQKHPNLGLILAFAKARGLIANMTINQNHLKPDQKKIEHLIKYDLIKGLGISYNSNNLEMIEHFMSMYSHVVIHMIMGVNTLAQLDRLIKLSEKINKPLKVLLLGYKEFGRGIEYHSEKIDSKKYEWYIGLAKYFKKENLVLSFDNLAIKQLNLKRYFTDEGWDKFYMGDDGQFTMYVDGVRQTYARSSTSSKRQSFIDKNIKDMFQEIRNM